MYEDEEGFTEGGWEEGTRVTNRQRKKIKNKKTLRKDTTRVGV